MKDVLGAAEIEAAARGRFGRPARHFGSIGSTNVEALEWALEGAPEGAVVTTDHQTAGRGRWGRTWSSEPGRLLQFSVVLRPGIPVTDAGLITTAAGVAVATGVEKATGLETRVKWPNDVTAGSRKLSGILVESEVDDGLISIAIAGVGINVDWAVADMPEEIRARATSISAATGRPVPRLELLVEVLSQLEAAYALACDPPDRSELIEWASARSSVLGRRVTVRFADGSGAQGLARRLLVSGALELVTAEGPREINVGEIEQLRTE